MIISIDISIVLQFSVHQFVAWNVHSTKLKIFYSDVALSSTSESSVAVHKVDVTRLRTRRAKVEAIASVTTRLRMAKGKAGGVLVISGIEEAMAGL